MSESQALPGAPRPQGEYVPAIVEGNLAMSAGMTPRVDGRLVVCGRVGAEVDLATAQEAAGIAARNAVAAIVAALGDAGRLRRFLRMTVYVACADGFHELSAVADGASAALLAAFPGSGAGTDSRDSTVPERGTAPERSMVPEHDTENGDSTAPQHSMAPEHSTALPTPQHGTVPEHHTENGDSTAPERGMVPEHDTVLPARSPLLPVRSAIGVRSLPSNAPVEVELTAAVRDPEA